ncbi:MAG: PrgI family protein [Candidatus Liptonbacteria bacterium]|nr:PrgI family protein [Candidatus Liptonbacteria bacterium]
MRYQVPQFIEAEDTLIGPLTLKQFIYIALGVGVAFGFFFILKFWVWVVFVAIIGTISVSLAFVTFNGRPLATVLLFAMSYYWSPRFYLWRTEAHEVGYRPAPPRDLSGGGRIAALWNNLLTSRDRLPFRASDRAGERRKEYIRQTTGERREVKRVDYL